MSNEKPSENADASKNPALDAPTKGPSANPPAAGEDPVTFKATDEVQREVDLGGNEVVRRSQVSAGQTTKDGITGAPDGIGGDLEGGQGQEAPKDITDTKAAAAKS